MAIPITDQFLWDVYGAVSKTVDIVSALTKPARSGLYIFDSDNPIFKKYRKDKNKRRFDDLIYYLKTKGYIKVQNLKNKKAIIITKEGFSKILKTSFKIEDRKKRQDGKWIMLIFDIPEKYKKSRNLLTSILHNLGYKMFQQSVWITPYDVSNKTEKLLQMYNLDRFVKIFLIEELD